MKFIKKQFPTSKILCNNGIIPSPKPNEPDFHCDAPFKPKSLEEAIKSQPFKIVHIATHGTFSSSPDYTFVLAYEKRINVDQLSELIRSREENRFEPIELLIFSACKTASGDKRAVLGIAGISVRVGARSTVASLYIVNDNSTSLLIKKFYKELSNVTKAEALHRAQLYLLGKRGYDKPKYWASYVLVGDWR